jgi:RNA polymerase sigma factor (sigma-70 family)
MATSQMSEVIQQLRRTILPPRDVERTDAQLLRDYLSTREESSLSLLVQRHGPMVWGVCRRMLRLSHDVEDAFQATFLVLVRKAASIASPDLVGNWLYGVAHQTARKARAMAVQREGREKHLTHLPDVAVTAEERWRDMLPLLDDELSRLPEKYRVAIVLCDLEGKTRKAAAQHLRCPEGTLAGRLTRGRELLAKRLARHGPPISVVALAAFLAQSVASAGLPAAAACSTLRAATIFATGHAASGGLSPGAVALAEGVLKTMLLTKLKIAAALVVVLGVLGAGMAGVTHSGPGDQPTPPQITQVKEPAPAPAAKKERAAEAAPTPTKSPAAPIPSNVSGVVHAIDAVAHTVTVRQRVEDDTFDVAPDAKIEVDGKPGKLADIPKGASINLRQFTDAKTIGSIVAEGRWFWGIVKEIDPAAGTLTFGEKAQDGAAGKTFVVPRNMSVSIDGKQGKMAAVPIGASVNLQLFVDQTTVRSLTAEGALLTGRAQAVDHVKRTITVNDATYPVAADAQVAIDFKSGTLEGVPAGANVTINLRVDQKTVLRIAANGASVFGAVKGVDLDKRTISVASQGEDRTFRVPDDTVIVIDNQPGSLAAIPTGAGLHALNLRADQQSAHSINVIGPGYHHVPVREVDAERKTITLDQQAPPEIAGRTIAVAGDANIEIDGKPGKLAAIPAGSFVNVGLSVDGLMARNLQAEGPNLGECGGSQVSAVDAVNDTITFDDKSHESVAGKTFRIAKHAWITIDGKLGKLIDLPVGAYVNITLTVDRETVRSLAANGPRLAGTVKVVDAANHAVAVDDMTYPVARDALVVIDGRTRSLSDLQAGVEVNVNFRVDQRTVGMIQTRAP